MSTYPSLKQFLTSHRFDDSSPASEVFCHESDDSPQVGLKRGPNAQFDWEEWVDHVTDAWREVCTIRTVEQLDALPVGCVLRDSLPNYPVVLERQDTSDAEDGSSGEWYAVGDGRPAVAHLPVLLIWHPDWSQS